MHDARFGTSVFLLIALVVALYVGYKIDQRRRFLKTLSVSRVTPEELKAKMDANESILIFDMRNGLDRSTDPVRIPGAFHVLPDHIDFRREDIARNQEIVLYCTCPNEATSARVALQLQRRGLKLARPLEGGLDAWRERNFPANAATARALRPTSPGAWLERRARLVAIPHPPYQATAPPAGASVFHPASGQGQSGPRGEHAGRSRSKPAALSGGR